MPPHEDEPLWPSADTDAADGGATAQLPVPPRPAGKPKPAARSDSDPAESPGEATQVVRPVSLAEQATVWAPLPATQRPPGPPAQPRPNPQRARPEPIPPQLSAGQPVPPAGFAHARPMRIEPNGEIHPAAMTTGETTIIPAVAAPNDNAAKPETPPPPPAEPEGPAEQPKPRRRKRGLIVTGLVLLLVIAAGVAAAMPYVSNRLGLPWAPNLPKGAEPQPATVNLALQAPSSSAPTPTASGVSSALSGPSSNGVLGTLTGSVIDPATGEMLWNHNSEQPLTPASTTKILTSAAALLALDHGLQLTTKVVQGSSPDTAIIVAGGDLTLSSLPAGKESVYLGAAHLDDLVAQVKQASGGAIKKVQIDLSAYTGAAAGPGWAPEDTPSTYATQVVPAMLDGGRQDPTNVDSMRVGNPAGSLLQSFAQKLGVATQGTGKAPEGAKVLGEVKSAPLTELIDNLMVNSDDMLAEAIGRQVAIGNGQPASFAGAAQATLNILSQNGFDISGLQLSDNSGLSTLNKVPARLLAQLLAVAAGPAGKDPRTAKLRSMLEGLPVAGGSGTLADRYDVPASSAGKGWVRAKTGTLSGVNTLAGIVLDQDGRVLAFALMSNGSDIIASRPALDIIAATLRGCGCR